MKFQHAIILVLCFHPIAYGSSASQEPPAPFSLPETEDRPLEPLALTPSVAMTQKNIFLEIANKIQNIKPPPSLVGSMIVSESSRRISKINIRPHRAYADKLAEELAKLENIAHLFQRETVNLVNEIYQRLGFLPRFIEDINNDPKLFLELSPEDLTNLRELLEKYKNVLTSLFKISPSVLHEPLDPKDIKDIKDINKAIALLSPQRLGPSEKGDVLHEPLDPKDINKAIALLSPQRLGTSKRGDEALLRRQQRSEQDFAKQHGWWPRGRPFRIII